MKALTPRQRRKGLVLPLSENEAIVLRAILGRTYDKEQQELIRKAGCYPRALQALENETASTKPIYNRLARACERRQLAR